MTSESIQFNYKDEDASLFENEQERHWRRIEDNYVYLRSRCLDEIPTPVEASQNRWVESRVNRLLTTSLTRLLYLAESFRDASINFNVQAAAVHVKAMTEPALHVANLAWILENKLTFEELRHELDIMAFGNRRADSGLTAGPRITHTVLTQRADELMQRFDADAGLEENPINVFETIYQESNSVGHHNFEGRDLLAGVQDENGIWRPKPRKEWFVFITSNIFPLFLHTSTLFEMSRIFIGAIDHYIERLPNSMQPDAEDA